VPSNTFKEIIDRRVKENVEGRKRMTRNLIVRVPDELYSRMEALADEMTRKMPGRKTTISDVARGILEVGLKDRPLTYSSFLRSQTEPQK
jgi:hypothetical protein